MSVKYCNYHAHAPPMKSETIDSAVPIATKTLTYSGAIGATVSGLSLSEIGVISGMVIGILGLVLGQFWSWRKISLDKEYKERQDRREQRELELRMKHKFGTDWGDL